MATKRLWIGTVGPFLYDDTIEPIRKADDVAGTNEKKALFEDSVINVEGLNTENLSGNKTLTVDDVQVQHLNPDGAARVVYMPPGADSAGKIYYIFNKTASGYDITVKDSTGAFTYGTIANGELGIVINLTSNLWIVRIL